MPLGFFWDYALSNVLIVFFLKSLAPNVLSLVSHSNLNLPCLCQESKSWYFDYYTFNLVKEILVQISLFTFPILF